MQEREIIKTFKAKKFLTLEEFSNIKEITKKTASVYLKALYNKDVLDKVQLNDKEYYFLTDLMDKEQAAKLITHPANDEAPKELKKPKESKDQKAWRFFDKLMSLLNKEVEIVYFDGTETHTINAILKAYEQNHLSLLLENEGRITIIRGNAVVAIKEK